MSNDNSFSLFIFTYPSALTLLRKKKLLSNIIISCQRYLSKTLLPNIYSITADIQEPDFCYLLIKYF